MISLIFSLPLSLINGFVTETDPRKPIICSLVCHRDVPFLVCCLLSYYFFSRQDNPCVIIDDGSLTKTDKTLLKKIVSDCKIISIYTITRNYQTNPLIQRFRRINSKSSGLVKKLIAIQYLNQKSDLIFFDADVFFRKIPNKIIEWQKEKLFPMYSIHPVNNSLHISDADQAWLIIWQMFISKYNTNIDFFYNSGVLCLPQKTVNQSRTNTVINYLESVGLASTWCLEQFTLSVHIFSQNNAVSLGEKYISVRTFREGVKYILNQSTIAIHYSHKSNKHFFLLWFILLIYPKILLTKRFK
jgi:hypothetical protein